MFAIQWALICCNIISCIPMLPAFLFPVDSDKFHAAVANFFNEGALDLIEKKDQPIIKLLFKFLFVGLTGVYVLGVFAGFYAPAVWVGYAFAIGNLLRVVYIAIKYMDQDTWVKGAFSNKQIGIICTVQAVFGLIMAGCTFLSSTNEDYQAFATQMAADSDAKWDTDGFYCKLIFGTGIFFVVFQIPPVLMPSFAWSQFQPVVEKQPTKESFIVVDFVFAFQAISILMTQALVATFVWFAPSVDGIAIWCVIFYVLYYPILVFNPVILNASELGMDPIPMLVFLMMNVFLGGVSLLAVFG